MNNGQNTIVWALCGSFCTFEAAFSEVKEFANQYKLLPLMSESAYSTSTRFGEAETWQNRITELCGNEIIHTIKGAEPIGPVIKPDLYVIAPCTGNTLAKLALGITDSSVTMGAKAQLRGNRPVLISLSTNDALSANLKNIGVMLGRKNVYFVPMSQDDPLNKPYSMIADLTFLEAAIEAALRRVQLQPVFK